ncbi:MAG: 50S ribosomal protein L17 [Bacteroidota bacterium]
MRHGKKINHLGRKSAHRKAMLANMASSLILHKRISTTTAKAKALRSYIEPLITKTKNLSSVDEKTHAQRVVFSILQNKEAVSELFSEVAPKVENRPGGYTRILKTGARLGDNADMCIIELVDYNENMLMEKDSKKAKTSRRRRGAVKKKGDETTVKSSEKEIKAQKKEIAQVAEEPDAPEAITEETETVAGITEEPVAVEETVNEPEPSVEEPQPVEEQETQTKEPVDEKENETDNEGEEETPKE